MTRDDIRKLDRAIRDAASAEDHLKFLVERRETFRKELHNAHAAVLKEEQHVTEVLATLAELEKTHGVTP